MRKIFCNKQGKIVKRKDACKHCPFNEANNMNASWSDMRGL